MLSAIGVQVLHVVGPANAAAVLDEPRPVDGGARYVAVPFIDHMDRAYAAADFVVCRAGALTWCGS